MDDLSTASIKYEAKSFQDLMVKAQGKHRLDKLFFSYRDIEESSCLVHSYIRYHDQELCAADGLPGLRSDMSCAMWDPENPGVVSLLNLEKNTIARVFPLEGEVGDLMMRAVFEKAKEQRVRGLHLESDDLFRHQAHQEMLAILK